MSDCSSLLMFRSPILAMSLDKKMLADFMSRWRILASWRVFRPGVRQLGYL